MSAGLHCIRYKNGLFRGVLDGVGIFIWDSGDIYIGQFSGEVFEGQGLIIKRDEYKLLGKFREGRLDGPQTVILKNGDTLQTTFKEGIMQENKVIKNMVQEQLGISFSIRNQRLERIDSQVPLEQDQSVDRLLREVVDHQDWALEESAILKYIEIDEDCYYMGYCLNNIPNGLGVFVFNHQKTHVGFYSQGILDGFGIIDFENGDKYRGVIRDDQFHGYGYMYNKKMNCYFHGEFVHGKSQNKFLQGNDSPLIHKTVIGHYLDELTSTLGGHTAGTAVEMPGVTVYLPVNSQALEILEEVLTLKHCELYEFGDKTYKRLNTQNYNSLMSMAKVESQYISINESDEFNMTDQSARNEKTGKLKEMWVYQRTSHGEQDRQDDQTDLRASQPALPTVKSIPKGTSNSLDKEKNHRKIVLNLDLDSIKKQSQQQDQGVKSKEEYHMKDTFSFKRKPSSSTPDVGKERTSSQRNRIKQGSPFSRSRDFPQNYDRGNSPYALNYSQPIGTTTKPKEQPKSKNIMQIQVIQNILEASSPKRSSRQRSLRQPQEIEGVMDRVGSPKQKMGSPSNHKMLGSPQNHKQVGSPQSKTKLYSPKNTKKLGSPKQVLKPSSPSVPKKVGSPVSAASKSKDSKKGHAKKLGSPKAKRTNSKIKEKVIKLDLGQLAVHPQTNQFMIREEEQPERNKEQPERNKEQPERIKIQSYIEQNQPPLVDHMTFNNSPHHDRAQQEEFSQLQISQTMSMQLQTQSLLLDKQQSPSAPALKQPQISPPTQDFKNSLGSSQHSPQQMDFQQTLILEKQSQMEQVKCLQQQQQQIAQQLLNQTQHSAPQDGHLQQISLRLQEQEEQIFSMQNVILYRNQLLNDQFMKQSHRESQVNNQYNHLLGQYDGLKAEIVNNNSQIKEQQAQINRKDTQLQEKEQEILALQETIRNQENIIKSYRQEDTLYELDVQGLEERVKEKGVVTKSDLDLWNKQVHDYRSINRFNQNTFYNKTQSQKDKFMQIDRQLQRVVGLLQQKQGAMTQDSQMNDSLASHEINKKQMHSEVPVQRTPERFTKNSFSSFQKVDTTPFLVTGDKKQLRDMDLQALNTLLDNTIHKTQHYIQGKHSRTKSHI